MTTRFATHFSNMAAPNLVRQFGETVTYKPHQDYTESTPTMRSISAIIDRQPAGTFAEDGDTQTPVWFITVLNDSTNGIASTEINTGGDQLSFAPRSGESAEYRTITRIVSHDHAMLRLECR